MSLEERYAGEMQDNLPVRRHFIRVWYGLTADVERGAGGWVATGSTALPKIGDAYPYGTWAGLINPRCARVDVDPRAQVGEIQAVAHYYGPMIEFEITAATGATYLEQACRRRHREYLKKDGKWKGSATYSVPTGSLSAVLPELRVLPWNVAGITMKPRYVEVLDQDPECPGMAKVQLEYEFGDNPRAYGRTDDQGVNIPSLAITGWGVNERLKYGQKDGKDDETQPIETAVKEDGTYYKLVEGSNQRPKPEAQYVLRTAMPQSNVALSWAKAYAGIGMVMKRPLVVKAGDDSVTMALKGELMLLRVEIPEYYIWDPEDLIIPVRYVFHFRKGGFSNCRSRRFQKAAVQEYVYHPTDDPVAWETSGYEESNARQWLLNDDSGDAVAATNPDSMTWGGVTYKPFSAPVTAAGASLSVKTRTTLRERPVEEAKDRTVMEEYDFGWLMSLVEW